LYPKFIEILAILLGIISIIYGVSVIWWKTSSE
jgi:hypothetical protein